MGCLTLCLTKSKGALMYHYSSGPDFGGVFIFIMAILFFLYLAAWAASMMIITDIADKKGHGDIKGQLWFIGLFGLIVTPALIVIALPDKSNNGGSTDTNAPDLPKL